MSDSSPENLSSIEPIDFTATHAGRHPAQPLIKARKNSKKKSKADKESTKLAQAAGREKNILLDKDVEELLRDLDAGINTVAEKHSKKPEYIKKLVVKSTHYKKKRAVSLRNAIVHWKSKQMNAGESGPWQVHGPSPVPGYSFVA